MKKYDGTNDGRLVVDSDGTARVGDVGDEQPLLTRAETADLVDGAPLVWDATNLKAVSGSAGGGSWTLRTPDNDWSDIFENDNGDIKSKKDLFIMTNNLTNNASIYIPKGVKTSRFYFETCLTSNTAMATRGLIIYSGVITGNNIGAIDRELSIDFDNKTFIFTPNLVTTISKSTITIYTKD